MIALAGLLSLAMPYTPQVRVAILIAGVPLVLGLVNTAIVAVLQARLRMDRAAISDVAGRAAGFVALIVVAALDLGFYAVVGDGRRGRSRDSARHLAARRARWCACAPPRAGPVWRSLLVAALPVGAALAVTEVYFRARHADRVALPALRRGGLLCARLPGRRAARHAPGDRDDLGVPAAVALPAREPRARAAHDRRRGRPVRGARRCRSRPAGWWWRPSSCG